MKGKFLGFGLILVFLFAFWIFISTYNTLVSLQESVSASWAQVENQLQRRQDLIPNLVETVKGYASHERSVLLEVTNARARVAQARDIEEKIKANNELEGALGRLLVIVERYPELKANQNFIRLQDELSGTENRIAVERRRYNETVRTYNTKIRTFPGNLVARIFGFQKAPLFEASPSAKEPPKVEFR